MVAPINNSNKSVTWHHLATQFLLLLMVTMGDGFTDCSVGISKVLKHQQHAYLVSQVTNKLDLYKLKLETKMDKIKLWELDEGSSNANSTEFKIINQLPTYHYHHLQRCCCYLSLSAKYTSNNHCSDGMETERSYSGRAGGQRSHSVDRMISPGPNDNLLSPVRWRSKTIMIVLMIIIII